MPNRCVVFGGTGDIGGTISDHLHRAAWAVVTVSRNARPSMDRPFRHIAADVASEESLAAAVREILLEGEMDAVVYSVGFAPDVQTPLSEYKTSDWRRTFSAYVDGLFYVYKAVFPFLRPGAHFVVISSAVTSLEVNQWLPFHARPLCGSQGRGRSVCKMGATGRARQGRTFLPAGAGLCPVRCQRRPGHSRGIFLTPRSGRSQSSRRTRNPHRNRRGDAPWRGS